MKADPVKVRAGEPVVAELNWKMNPMSIVRLSNEQNIIRKER
ncbi:MAG TPA: hypothetical protein VJX93_03045 [Candidatus Methanomethylophilaceae archaeon]|nr:hypothetical protein [Candidatus Methanomethylophilaceae archaeon]